MPSRISNLAGFTTSITSTTNLNVGVVTASSFVGNLTGTASTATSLSGTPNITIGNLIGVGATFTGNVSIAGTLTYEDVTNVDSIGLITARSGIINNGILTTTSAVVGSAVTINSSGINAVGVITATSFIGSGANLTGLPAGYTDLDNALFG